ncbi:MAG: hypothetical protein L0Z73_06370 [Gammaproteobacteria bacterium]|nr:hypothetical protein [Gammaproteobacteria bacterium]
MSRNILTRTSSLLALTLICAGTSAHAERSGQYGASGAFHFKNSSLMVQGRHVKPVSPKTRIAPAIAFDFDLEEVVLDLDFQILNPGTRYYGLGGINYADSDTGLNFGIGMNFNYNAARKGYGELKYIFFGWSGFVVNAGVYF